MGRAVWLGVTGLVWLVAGLPGVSLADDPINQPADLVATPKQILMIAGPRSHGFGAHEHYAGLRILADQVDGPDAEVTVTRGWPEDESLIDRANAIVFYADGGGRHPALPHLDRLERAMNAGCGLAAIHYATETVDGPVGDRWLSLMGGHFEIHHSVNPHWVARLDLNDTHPVTSGLEDFSTNDEWYFHLRFAGEGVTPLAQAVAPESTMRRGDGPHEGNAAVRKSVAAGQPQTLAWSFERPAGGRAFGITGGHHHWVWGDESMRRLTARGIRWSAGLPPAVPEGAMEVTRPMLLEHQDYDQPEDFDPSVINQWLIRQ